MINENNKKKSVWRLSTAWLFIFLFMGFFLFGEFSEAVTGDYNKSASTNNTLSASEWNNLILDFISNNGGRINGPLSINTATSSTYALDVNGTIRSTTFIGSYTGTLGAANVSAGEFGSNTAGGNFSFGATVPGNLGIGMINPTARFAVRATSTNDIINLFDNTGVEKMTVLNSGNVGIGTTNPTKKLVIGNSTEQNTIQVTGLNTTDMAPVVSLFRSNSAEWVMAGYGNGVASTGFMIGNNPTSYTDVNLTTAAKLVINSSGNVGIGTTNPNSKLDINGALSISGNAVLSMPSNNPEVGPWNPIWNAVGSSKPLFFDEEFALGNNSISVYNNSGGTAVTITRLTGQTGIPNSTGATLKISYDGIGPNGPGFGGFLQAFVPVANRTYVQRFRAKLPVGKNLVLAENAQGTNNTSYWLTNTVGTGKWEDYIRVSHAGNTGSFSVGGHVYATGGSGAFDWYLASANVYEVNTPIIASPNTWGSAQTFGGGAYFPGSGIWNTSGNVGIGTTNPATAKLVIAPSGSYSIDAGGGRIGNISSAIDSDAASVGYVKSIVAGTSTIPTVGYWTANGTNIYNANTGNVGIGTTNPGVKLDIRESANIDTVGSALSVTKTGGATANNQSTVGILSQITVPDGADTFGFAIKGDSVKVGSFGKYSAGVLGQGRYNGTPAYALANLSLFGVSGFTQITGDTTALPVGNAYSLYSSGDIQSSLTNYFSLYLATPSGAGVITNKYGLYQQDINSKNYFGGNLGVGINTPSIILDVRGTGNGLPAVSGTAQANASLRLGNAVTNGVIDMGLNAANGWIQVTNRSDLTQDYPLSLNPNGGNVGIGTTTPTYKLDVRATGPSYFDQPVFVGTPTANGHAATKGYVDSSITDNSSWLTNGTNIYNSNTGNVGIGTTDPGTYKLNVNGDTNITGNLNVTGGITGGTMTGTLAAANVSSGAFASNTGGGNFSFPGNVGIGTTNPQWALDIAKAGSATSIHLAKTDATTSSWYLHSGRLGTGEFSIADDSAYRLTIASGGNVGIGTTAPTANVSTRRVLQISDTTNNAVLRVTGGGGADVELSSVGGNSYLATQSASSLFFGTNGTTKMGISPNGGLSLGGSYAATDAGAGNMIISGNVGIGTATPEATLTVNNGGYKQQVIKNTIGSQKLWLGSIADSVGTFIGSNAYYSNSFAFVPNYTAAAGISFRQDGSTEFWNDTGLTSGTSYTPTKRMVISNGGNFGIGTTNPGAYRLNVNGDTNITGSLNVTGSITGGTMTGTLGAGNVSAGAFASNTGGGNFSFPGNVGIGTTAPGTNLEVLNSIMAKSSGANPARLQLYATGTGDADIIFDAQNGDGTGGDYSWMGQHDNGNFFITNYGQERVTIGTTGNVGIGVTNPGQNLEILESASGAVGPVLNLVNPTSATSSAVEMRFAPSGSYAGRYASIQGINRDGQNNIELGFLTGAGGTITEKMRINSTGSVGIGTNNPTYLLDVSGTFRTNGLWTTPAAVTQWGSGSGSAAYGGLTWGAGSATVYSTAGNILNFGSGGAAPDMTINTTGNVGIGTTTPAYKLDVRATGPSYFDQPVFVGTPTANGHAATKNYVDSLINPLGGGGGTVGYWNASGANVYNVNTGNIGIGTNNPIFKLHLVDTNGGFFFDGSGASYNRFKSTAASAATGRDLLFSAQDSGTSPDLYIKNNGNVGIGTTDPGTYKLNVNGNTNITGSLNVTGAITGGTMTGTLGAGNVSAGAFASNTGGGNFSFPGNVGIGTTNPGSSLDIESPGSTTLAIGMPAGATSGTIGILKFQRGVSDWAWAGIAGVSNYTDQNGLAFYTTPGGTVNAIERMRISQGGNVGIGTTNPGQKLDVVGNLRLNGDIVYGNQSATYKNNYVRNSSFARARSASSVDDWTLSGAVREKDGGRDYIKTSGIYYFASQFYTADDINNLATRTFIMSADVKNTTGTGSVLFYGFVQGSNPRWVSWGIYKPSVTGVWQRVVSDPITFAAGDTYVSEIRFYNYPGSNGDTVYMDNLKFEESSVPTIYNGSNESIEQFTTTKDTFLATNSGYVGIGTTDPGTYKLNVNGNTNITGSLNVTGAITGGTMTGTLGAGNVSAGAFASNTGGGNFSFPGNVGIGTTNPSAKLNVIGNVVTGNSTTDLSQAGSSRLVVSDSTFTNTRGIGFYAADGTKNPRAWMQQITATDGSSQYVDFNSDYSSGSTRANWVFSNGNVGIGTTNPQFPLVVSKNATTPIIQAVGSLGAGNELGFGVDGSGGYVQQSGATTPFRFYVNGASRFGIHYNGGVAFGSAYVGTNLGDGSAIFSGNVGVGTTNPTSPIQIGNRADTGNNAGRLGIYSGSDDFNVVRISANSATPATLSFGVNDVGGYSEIQAWESGVNYNDNLILQRQGGNVGIGTTTPAYKLDVRATGPSYFDQPVFVGSPTAPGHAATKDYVDSTIIGEPGSTVGYWTMNGTNIYNSNGGNVGIGTNNPFTKFEVIKTASGSSTIATSGTTDSPVVTRLHYGTVALDFGILDSGVGYIQNRSVSDLATNFKLLINPNGGNVGIGTTDPGVYKLNVNGNTNIAGSLNVTGAITGGTMTGTLGAGNVSAGAFASNTGGGNFSFPGNVGIGTTNPGFKLDLNLGSVTSNSNIGYNVFADTTSNVGYSGYNLQLNNSSANASGYLRLSRTSGTAYLGMEIASQSRDGIRFLTDDTTPTEAMRINASGNVGIGTTAPSSKLHVVAPDGTNIGGYKYNFILDAQDGNVVDGNGLLVKGGANNALGTSFAVQDYSGGTNLMVTGLGNVGIGTTNPKTRLQVNETALSNSPTLGTATGSMVVGEVNGAYGLNIGVGGSGNTWIQSQRFDNATSTYNIVLNPLGGNVGIGTTDPGVYKLNVNGNTNITGTLNVTGAITGGAMTGTLAAGNVSAGAFASNTGGGNFSFPGNVGIGTTNPLVKFQVNGPSLSLANNYHYRDLTDISWNGAASGTLKIVMPVAWTNTMGVTTIKGYSYDGIGAWEVVVSGYNYSGNNSWINTSAEIKGRAPFSSVRLAFDGTNVVILLGTTSTTWSYPKISVTDFVASHSTLNVWGNGWSMSFITDESNISAVSTPTIYTYLNASGNLGIGTLAPGATLPNGWASSVDSKILQISSASSNYDTGLFLRRGDSYTGLDLWSDNSTGDSFIDNRYNNDAGDIKFRTKTAGTPVDAMTIIGSGNVGVGTTNPGAKLDLVTQNAGVYPFFARYDGTGGGTANKFVIYPYSDGNTYLQHDGKVVFAPIGSVTPQLAIDTTGNIGIGTINPGSNLDISTTATTGFTQMIQYPSTVSGNWAGISIGHNSTASDKIGIIGQSRDGWGRENLIFAVNTDAAVTPATPADAKMMIDGITGNIGIGTTTPAYKLDVRATGPSYFDQPVFVGSPTADGHAATKNYVDSVLSGGSGSTVGYWTMNGTSIYNSNGGNIGIGTTTPGAKLDIYGGNSSAGDILMGNWDSSANFNIISLNGLGGNNYNFLSSKTSNSQNLYINRPTGGSIVFRYNNLDQAVLDTSGNLGIGTATPGAYKLNVNGDTNISGDLNVTGTITGGAALTGTLNAGNISAGAFASNTGGGNFSFPGNVGIGTTAPSAPLHVYNAAAVPLLLERSAAQNVSVQYKNTGSSIYSGLSDANNFSISTGASLSTTALLTIQPGGNVGIGTTAPGVRLQTQIAAYGYPAVSGTTQTYGQLRLSSGQTGTVLDAGVASGASWIQSTASSNLGSYGYFLLNPNGGNVGIGTTNPAEAKLVIDAGAGLALKAYGNGIFTGTLQTQTGSDFAEEFATTKDLEPGTVVVMDDSGYKSVRPCAKSYDRTVVGIVSNNPSIIAGRINSNHKAIVAMMGVVKVKVSDINGGVAKGDLLTTSGIKGYAMKAIDSKPGTIIGKALEDLNGTSGEINVLVNLQ